MTEFSDYLAAARASRSGGGKAMSPVSAGTAKAKSGGQDPLSWLVDILSRPMRAVENIPNSIFDEMLKSEQANKTGQSYNVLGGIGNVLGSPVRGLFSTNAADQPTGAQLIEKGTDAMGGLNPNYVDTQDNVNPILKGVAGFGLDVGLDPLTYIPGAQLAEAGKWVARGAKGAAEAADALVAGSNVGKLIGSDARLAAKATAEADAGKAALQEAMAAKQIQPYLLSDTAFGAKVPLPKTAAEDIAARFSTSQFTKPTFNLTKTPIGPITKEQLNYTKSLAKAGAKQADAVLGKAAVESPDVAALMDKVGAPVGSTVREQFAATGALPNIEAALAKIKPATVEIATPPAGKLAEPLDFPSFTKQYKEQLKADPANADFVPTTQELRSEHKQYLKDFTATQSKAAVKREAITTQNFSASQVLKNMLANDPIASQQLVDALGPATVQKLSEIKQANHLTSAVEHLGRVVRGEAGTGTKLQEQVAQELRAKYDIKVPGTEAPAISGVSAVGTPIVAEAQVAEAAGQTMLDVPWIGGYSRQQIEEVIRDMPEYLKGDFLNVEGYNSITRRGALSTSVSKGEGLHKFQYEFNQYDQYSLLEALIKSDRADISAANDAARAAGDEAGVTAGIQRAEKLKFASLKKVELALRWLDTKGASVWMGVKENRIRLYMHQMLSEVNATARALKLDDTLSIALFNKSTTVPITNIMDAVVGLYKNPALSEAEVLGILKGKASEADNFLNTKQPALWRHYFNKPAGLFKENIKDGKLKGYYGLVDPKQFGNELVTVLREAAPSIEKIVAHNEDMAISRTIAEAQDLSVDVIDSIARDAEDPKAFGDLMRKIANIPVHVGERGAANWVKPQLDQVVAKPATDYWPNNVLNDAQHQINLVKAAAKNDETVRQALIDLNTKQAVYTGKNAEQVVGLRGSMFDGVTKDGRIVNEAMYNDAVNEQALNEMLQAGRVAKVKELLQYKAGKEQVIHPYDQVNVQLTKGLVDYHLNVERVRNLHAGLIEGTQTSVIAQAFRDIAVAEKSSTGAVAAARADLEPLIWSVFGNPKDANAMGIWQTAGGDLTDLQVYMRKARLDYTVDLAAASEKAARDGISEVAAGLTDWTAWADKIDNPLKFLQDMYWAGSMMHVDKKAAALFVARAGVTSKVAKSGYTKIPELNLFEHPLMGHMPKDTFIKNDILQEVNNLEKMLLSDYSPKSPFGKWLNNSYLPLLGAWKKGVTIYRPGHHIRNLLSSEGIQYTVEGTRHYMRSGTAAFKVLMKHKSYEGVDWSKTVSEIDTLHMPTGGDKLFTFGKNDISVDTLFEAAEKHGLFTDFRTIEDLFKEGEVGALEKFVNKVSLKDTAVERLAGGVSEYQAHYSRLHHFTQILMKQGTKGKSWEKAVEEAAMKVRRHHPDGMGLTPFERAYIKPLIPFYSWFRQVIPVIAEGIYQHPGRFMQYPKASYNLAVAMGVDPQSLQDPFPANKLFPSFVTDQLTGPVAQINGNYFTGQPGYAYADILNQFVANPKQGIMGMVTPFIKVPGELITGTKWDTGVSIKDYSDYVDSQLPGINYLSNFTGISTTGSAVSVITGQGIDRQYAVDKGNKTLLDQGISVSNWFTGMGVQNISKPNYTNYAEIEKRNAAAKQQKQDQGKARSGY